MDAIAAFERAIRIAGSECKLAVATGYSQVAINKAKRRGSVSPQMALAVHRFTGGAVPASALRPDLWARPQDVPLVDEPVTSVAIRPPARASKAGATGRAP
jgi:DNA-binding transcriptional regulator YdaS (Cro superfamily)